MSKSCDVISHYGQSRIVGIICAAIHEYNGYFGIFHRWHKDHSLFLYLINARLLLSFFLSLSPNRKKYISNNNMIWQIAIRYDTVPTNNIQNQFVALWIHLKHLGNSYCAPSDAHNLKQYALNGIKSDFVMRDICYGRRGCRANHIAW